MNRAFLFSIVLLLTTPLVMAQDESETYIACDETLTFDMPDGFLLKEFSPSLKDDNTDWRIVLATREELLEAFPEDLKPDDIHISLTRQPATEDIEPADYLSTYTQFSPVNLTINDHPAAVVYQQDPTSGVQQILLTMVATDEVVLWVNASTLDRFSELEMLTDALVQSLEFPDSLLDENWQHYYTEDCQTRFEYPAEWTVTTSDTQISLTTPGTDVATLTIIPPEHLWEHFDKLDPALVTIDQLFNAYIQAENVSTKSNIEWDGNYSWTLDTENYLVMVRDYDQQQVAMFIVKGAIDEQIEIEIDQILASFSVNPASD